MKNVYVVYAKVGRGTWENILETPSRKVFEETIYGMFDVQEMVQVITKYRGERGDYLLVSFCNKSPRDSFDLQKVYRFLPKKGGKI